MTKPTVGEIFRYRFLWTLAQITAVNENRKQRSVCVAMTVAKSAG